MDDLRQLQTDISRITLSLSVYFFGVSAGQLVYGPLLERFGRISYQNSLATFHLKQIQLLSMNGMERYLYFRKKYPELDRRIPQKHIASYLGFTPEFFNTIRSKAMRADADTLSHYLGV